MIIMIIAILTYYAIVIRLLYSTTTTLHYNLS